MASRGEGCIDRDNPYEIVPTETTTADTSAAVVRSDALRNFHQVVSGLGGDPEALLAKSQIESAALKIATRWCPTG